MSSYPQWRNFEAEFSVLAREQAQLWCQEQSSGEWITREGDGGRLEALGAIAAHRVDGIGTFDHWIDLVKDFLLARESPRIQCTYVTSAGGIPAGGPITATNWDDPAWPKIRADDPRVKHCTLYSIYQIAKACAEYCLELARRALVTRTVSKCRPKPQPPRPMRWEDIQIRFLSDDRVDVLISGQHTTYNSGEMGFVDGRTGSPSRSWLILRFLAEQGSLSQARGLSKNWAAFERQIGRVRKQLQEFFGLAANPLPYVPRVGYKPLFQIGCARSFHS